MNVLDLNKERMMLIIVSIVLVAGELYFTKTLNTKTQEYKDSIEVKAMNELFK